MYLRGHITGTAARTGPAPRGDHQADYSEGRQQAADFSVAHLHPEKTSHRSHTDGASNVSGIPHITSPGIIGRVPYAHLLWQMNLTFIFFLFKYCSYDIYFDHVFSPTPTSPRLPPPHFLSTQLHVLSRSQTNKEMKIKTKQ